MFIYFKRNGEPVLPLAGGSWPGLLQVTCFLKPRSWSECHVALYLSMDKPACERGPEKKWRDRGSVCRRVLITLRSRSCQAACNVAEGVLSARVPSRRGKLARGRGTSVDRIRFAGPCSESLPSQVLTLARIECAPPFPPRRICLAVARIFSIGKREKTSCFRL